MVAQKTLTNDGSAFVRKCLDPFHDFEVSLRGMPDTSTSRVVIQEVTKSVTYKCPFAAGSWDLHIATMPDMMQSNSACKIANMNQYGTVQYTGITQPTTGFRMHPVTLSAVPTGKTFPADGAGINPLAIISGIDFDEFGLGQRRLIAMAFEVHNTTAELYRQGSVLVYRQPNCNTFGGNSLESSTPGTQFYKTTLTSRLPPSDLAECQLLVGSRQWEAAEGCYVVSTMDITNNMLAGSTFATRLYTAGDVTADGVTATVYAPASAESGLCKPTPYHISGAYFTGLSFETSLTITVKMIYEACPTPENVQLVVLSQPSPDYDPVALEIYKSVVCHLPPGVKVSMNASGDFWDNVLGLVAKYAPVVGKILPLPGGGLIGEGIGSLAGGIQSSRNSSERKQIQGDYGATGNKNAVPEAKKR